MKKFLYLLTLLITCTAPIGAQSPITEERTEKALSEPESKEVPEDNFTGEILNVVLALALIIIFMIIATYYLRKFMAGRMEQMNVTSTIKIMDQRNLSAKTVLYIIEAHGKQFIVGESATGAFALGEIPAKFQDVYEK